MTTSTSASLREATPWPPAKMTSCIVCPRIASGDCSPSAHRTASVMFDLPEPFGPMITAIPGPNSSRVRFGNDLKPLSVSDLRCIRSVLVHRLQCSKRGGLLRSLLAFSCTTTDFLALDLRHRLEAAVVRRSVLARNHILDDLTAAREPFLKQRLEIVRTFQSFFDLALEGLDHSSGGLVIAVRQVHGTDHG